MKEFKYFLLTKSLGLYINMLSYVRPQKASLLAYRLFSEPRDGRLAGSLPAVLQQSEQESINYNGEQFQIYKWQGNENVILLIHGWESNSSRWEKMLSYLISTGSTVLAVDGPAHGLSSGIEFNIPHYAAVIDRVAQKYKPHFLIGHSLGGAACVYYQHKYQHASLRKMVLLGAPSDLKVLVSNYTKLLSLNNRMQNLLSEHFFRRFKFRPEDFSAGNFCRQFTVPGLIIHDVDDTVVRFEEGRKIASGWKSARFVETKGLGHSMHDEKLYLQVVDFLFAD